MKKQGCINQTLFIIDVNKHVFRARNLWALKDVGNTCSFELVVPCLCYLEWTVFAIVVPFVVDV